MIRRTKVFSFTFMLVTSLIGLFTMVVDQKDSGGNDEKLEPQMSLWKVSSAHIADHHAGATYEVPCGSDYYIQYGQATEIPYVMYYEIKNEGSSDLEVQTPIQITGMHGGRFSVIHQPSAQVPAGASTHFVLQYLSPDGYHEDSAEISIQTNDPSGLCTISFAVGCPVEAVLEVEAVKTDALVGVQDGEVNLGDTVRYTVVLSNVILAPTTSQVFDVVFTSNVDPNSKLIVGSVTTSAGVILEGNTTGDMSVHVQIDDIQEGFSDTVTYDVLVSTCAESLYCQGFYNYSYEGGLGVIGFPTDDPDLPGAGDPTGTLLVCDSIWVNLSDATAGKGPMDPTNPGDVIKYTLTIDNHILGQFDSVKAKIALDSNTTLDPTSFSTHPLAFSDTVFALASGIPNSYPVGTLLQNDWDEFISPNGLLSTVSEMLVTGNNANVVIGSDGSFSYTNPFVFGGADFFYYTVIDPDGNTDLGLVIVYVSTPRWQVVFSQVY